MGWVTQYLLAELQPYVWWQNQESMQLCPLKSIWDFHPCRFVRWVKKITCSHLICTLQCTLWSYKRTRLLAIHHCYNSILGKILNKKSCDYVKGWNCRKYDYTSKCIGLNRGRNPSSFLRRSHHIASISWHTMDTSYLAQILTVPPFNIKFAFDRNQKWIKMMTTTTLFDYIWAKCFI